MLDVGAFTTMNAGVSHRVARLDSNGSLDGSFNPGTGADHVVASLALQPDGNVLLGGHFTTVDGLVRPHVARLFGGAVNQQRIYFRGAPRHRQQILSPELSVKCTGTFRRVTCTPSEKP